MSTLFASDWLVRRPDWPGFRMFPGVPGVAKPWNPVRVPPRAQHTPLVRGVFCFNVCTFWLVGPSDTGRGVCLAPRVACEVVGGAGSGSWLMRLRLL